MSNDQQQHDFVELIKLDNSIKLDMKYASIDNFVGRQFYDEPRAFLQRPAAEALIAIHRNLKQEHGVGLLVYDAYRPFSVTKQFYDFVSDDLKKFVANPSDGSKHNRGCAIDLALYDLKTGEPLPMPSKFDEFTDRASPLYTAGSDLERNNRDLLRSAMESNGLFAVDVDEWWHFDFFEWQQYAICDLSFRQIDRLHGDRGMCQ